MDDEASPEVTAHLTSCPSCRAELSEYLEIGARMAQLEMIEVRSSAHVLDGLLASVPGPAALRVRAVAKARTTRYALTSLGGVAVGAGAIGLVWWRRGRRVVEDATGRIAASV